MCDICNSPNVDLLETKLKKNKIKYKLELGCQNMCAVGQKHQFAIVNGQVIIKTNQIDLIDEILSKIV